jgi:hypothetical protein
MGGGGAGEPGPTRAVAMGPQQQYVGFRLDGTDYALSILRIREIILMRPITRLPQVPSYIEGLVNLRGTVIPVVSLRKRFGLPARKATALVRIWRTFDPERLRRLPHDAAAARLERERGIGPYSVGFVWTQGLGRYARGIVGDLGLLKICSAIEGRWVEAEDTARILARYEEWAGLACVYLMAGAARGMGPLKLSPPEVRRERIKARRAA